MVVVVVHVVVVVVVVHVVVVRGPHALLLNELVSTTLCNATYSPPRPDLY